MLLVSFKAFPCDGGMSLRQSHKSFIPVNSFLANDFTEQEFKGAIKHFEKFFGPQIEDEHNVELIVFGSWASNTVNAYAEKSDKKVMVTIYGGLARHKAITKDGFIAVLCHELGHHFGGYPKKSTNKWSSAEGQADYYASMKCLRRLWKNEDNAQAIGADYLMQSGVKVKSGTVGHIGSTSFYTSKNLGAYGDGGALYTQDAELARKIKMIANHGQEQKYIHDVVGCNSRLDTIQAAVLRIKLRQLDNYIDARREVAAAYDAAFAQIPGIEIPFRAADSKHVFHQYTLKLKGHSREALQAHLQVAGIPSMIYYPIPAHRQKMFAAFNLTDLQLPITEQLCAQVISLPIHTEMDEQQLQYIIEHVQSFFQ
jgi:hypothetical protein